jgi:hypothetical protein
VYSIPDINALSTNVHTTASSVFSKSGGSPPAFGVDVKDRPDFMKSKFEESMYTTVYKQV